VVRKSDVTAMACEKKNKEKKMVSEVGVSGCDGGRKGKVGCGVVGG